MAQQDRNTLQALIDLYITTNGNKDITGAQLNEVLTNLNESAFLQLNELRTALSTSYNPTNSSDWLPEGDPTEVGGGLDVLAARTGKNLPNTIVYVCKDTANPGVSPEVGNPLKPFATITDAVSAMPLINGILKVLGGDYYSEEVTLNVASNDCIFDFGNCRINKLTATFTTVEDNNNIIQNLRIDNATGEVNLRATFIDRLVITNHNMGLVIDSKNCSNSTFAGPRSIATFAAIDTTFYKTFTNCKIINTGAGHAIRLSSKSIFVNCEIESNTGTTFDTFTGGSVLVENTINLYNCSVKGVNEIVSGVNTDGDNTNMIAYNTKFYSSAGSILKIGDNSKFLLFQGCEFYTKLANNVIEMKANIVRPVTDTYTFKECTFNTVTGFPLLEPTYGGGDLGNTLFLNCIYNAGTATSVAPPVKLTEQNSLSYPNYTDFNNLQ